MENGHTQITLLGQALEVTLPGFAVREELQSAATEACSNPSLLRVCAAAICLATPLGKQYRLDYLRAKCNPLAYGGAAYDAMRERGATAADIAEAATPILRLVRDSLYPRADEVAEAEDFTGAAAEAGTEKPSPSA